jgi:hypothetical protein
VALVLSVIAMVLSQIANARGWLHSRGAMHVLYHVGLFAAFGLLATRTSIRPWMRLCWLGAAVMFGLGMEYGEAVRYHSTVEWVDVGIDTAGVAAGAIAGWLLSCRAGRAP